MFWIAYWAANEKQIPPSMYANLRVASGGTVTMFVSPSWFPGGAEAMGQPEGEGEPFAKKKRSVSCVIKFNKVKKRFNLLQKHPAILLLLHF